MEVTLFPMVTEANFSQPPKADLPMDSTLLGMVTEVRPLQQENILNIDNQ